MTTFHEFVQQRDRVLHELHDRTRVILAVTLMVCYEGVESIGVINHVK